MLSTDFTGSPDFTRLWKTILRRASKVTATKGAKGSSDCRNIRPPPEPLGMVVKESIRPMASAAPSTSACRNAIASPLVPPNPPLPVTLATVAPSGSDHVPETPAARPPSVHGSAACLFHETPKGG